MTISLYIYIYISIKRKEKKRTTHYYFSSKVLHIPITVRINGQNISIKDYMKNIKNNSRTYTEIKDMNFDVHIYQLAFLKFYLNKVVYY